MGNEDVGWGWGTWDGDGEHRDGGMGTWGYVQVGWQVGAWVGVGEIGNENIGVHVGGMGNGSMGAALNSSKQLWTPTSLIPGGMGNGNMGAGVGKMWIGNMGLEIENVEVGRDEEGGYVHRCGEDGKGVSAHGYETIWVWGDREGDVVLEVLLTSIFWQATNVHLIWLQSTESEYQSRTHKRANMEQKK
ncbi:hypothetical protein EDB89DRAFT_1915643 [Lactarius sanguifluus]|nr:hypothetical protein EDB89DRAFT_1915643 [Lactarius sanguifluus]